MNYYDKINWKNRSEGKTTKISAERLNHMDNQIFNNANAIGNVEKIADIGDGTLCGAAETLKETAEKLTQSLGIQKNNIENIIKLLWSGVINKAATVSMPASTKKYSLFLVLYSIGDSYYSDIILKNKLTSLQVTLPEKGYYQTTYLRQITISDSQYVTTQGIYGRSSASEFSTFEAIAIKYIYGIK